MRERLLLDCTLRDGGYINDWEFGHDNIVNIFERVICSGVDIIEIGFIDDRREFDINRSIMPDTDSIEKIYGRLKPGSTMVVGMIDYGTCDISHVKPCNESYIDGIRVIFKKEKMYDAMEYCGKLKKLGYKVFSQMVSITSYSDDELVEMTRLANNIMPYAVSIVDTYGLVNPEELKHIMSVLDENLDKEIIMGFHAHNNFQLGYVNATTALDYDTNRDILVDGTLYGMGKSAGNAPLELVAMYMNEHYGKSYVVSEMQEAITSSVMEFQKKSPWGYQLFYYIAAANRVHPNYVSYLMNKRTLSITQVNEILKRIPEEEKLNKNMKLIEQLYVDFQTKECDDGESLRELAGILEGKDILVVGPGKNATLYGDRVKDYVKNVNPVIISINYIPTVCHPDYMFVTNSTRFVQSVTKLHDDENKDIKIIASSNLKSSDRNWDYVVNYSSVIDEKARVQDHSMCMLLRVLAKCAPKKVALAGFDGYNAQTINIFDEDKDIDYLEEKAAALNKYATDFVKNSPLDIVFVTPSKYEIEVSNED